MSGFETLWVVIVVVVALAAIPLFFVWRKGRRFTEGDVFRASRWSRGNRLFPTQVAISPAAVVHFTPEWVGRREQSIHIAHIASVSIDTNLLFSDVIIETTGGATPVRCYGHRKRDAVEMKRLIERHQTAYYRKPSQDTSRHPEGAAPESG